MNNRWVISEEVDPVTVKSIAETENIPETLAKILISRGITEHKDIKSFFRLSLSDLHSPFEMDGMEAAVTRILRCKDSGEQVWIYGDYDVDGTTSTAMLTHFLERIGMNVRFILSDRFTENYGLGAETIELARQEGASLIICLDSGTTSIDSARFARAVGVDLIICDHHEPGDEIPVVVALLNPIKGSCNYPFKNLCAGGITFKLIQGISERLGKSNLAFDYLDLVAIATVADMVPLVGENRVLVHFGLEKLKIHVRPGIAALFQCTNVTQKHVNTNTIIHNIAPRLNAAGRLGDASMAVQLMMEGNEIAAYRLAQDLESKNHQRRVLDDMVFCEAKAMATRLLSERQWRSLVLYNPNWHIGVINIVASRIVEHFHLPAVLLTSLEGTAKGSIRSIRNFDVLSAVKECGHLLKQFGGHRYAVGLSFDPANLDKFRDAFDATVRGRISEDMLVPEVIIDTTLKLSELSPSFVEMIQLFAPFGYHNAKPVFVSHNVAVERRASIVGKNHLKFRARQGNFQIDAIGFNLGHFLPLVESGEPLSLVYTIEETIHRKVRHLQLYIKDVRATREVSIIKRPAAAPDTETADAKTYTARLVS